MQHSKQNEQYVPTLSWKHVGRTERRQVWLKDSEPKKQKGSGGERRGGRKSTRQCRTSDFILQVTGNHWRKVVFSRGVIPFKIFSKCLFVFLLGWAFNDAHGLSLAARSRGYSLVAVCVLLTAVASSVSEHGLSGVRSSAVVVHRLSCPAGCGILLGQRSNPCSLCWQVDSQPLDCQGGLGKNFNLCFNKVPLVVIGRMSYIGTGVKIAC